MRLSKCVALSAVFILPGLLLLDLGIGPPEALADGLYVGHGRRSHHGPTRESPWSVRLNLAGGLHGASDPWEGVDHAEDDFHTFGGYGLAGIEFHMGHNNSVEVYGSFRDIRDEERFLDVDPVDSFTARGGYVYDVETMSGGLVLRHYVVNGSGAAYWGVGAGLIETEVSYQEVVGGDIGPFEFDDDRGAEAQVLLGWDGRLSPGLALGIEVGYRHTWLEYENPAFFDTGDTSGLFGGLRLGVLFGG